MHEEYSSTLFFYYFYNEARTLQAGMMKSVAIQTRMDNYRLNRENAIIGYEFKQIKKVSETKWMNPNELLKQNKSFWTMLGSLDNNHR